MKYTEYRDAIDARLSVEPAGLTWTELRAALALPYDRPCPEWTKRLEIEIGLTRKERKGRELLWRIPAKEDISRGNQPA